MRFTAATVAFFAGLAVAAPGAADHTVYETDEVTITSCAPTVTDCPGRSTAEPTPTDVGASETPAWSETPAVSSSTPAWSETPVWSETPAWSSVPTTSAGGWAPSSSVAVPAPPAVTSASWSVTAITTCVPTVVYSTVPVGGPAPSGVSPSGYPSGGVPHVPSGSQGVSSGTAAASPSSSPSYNGAGALSGSLGFAGAAAAAAFFLA